MPGAAGSVRTGCRWSAIPGACSGCTGTHPAARGGSAPCGHSPGSGIHRASVPSPRFAALRFGTVTIKKGHQAHARLKLHPILLHDASSACSDGCSVYACRITGCNKWGNPVGRCEAAMTWLWCHSSGRGGYQLRLEQFAVPEKEKHEIPVGQDYD